MLHTKKIILLFTIYFLIISCSQDFFDKPIDLDIDNQPSKLAGTAFLGNSDTMNQVLVSHSQNPLGEADDNQLLNNATVTLSSNSDIIDFYLAEQDGFYTPNSAINFIPNTEYTLTIESPDYETIVAKQTYPEVVTILEVSFTEKTLKIKINDNPNKKNYYLLDLIEYIEGGEFSQVRINPFGTLTEESGVCSSCVSFSDDTFDGEQNFEIVVATDRYSPELMYKVVLYNVTEDFYRYDTTLRVSDYAEDNPFAEPVILHRNFENGYGVFALANKTEFIFEE